MPADKYPVLHLGIDGVVNGVTGLCVCLDVIAETIGQVQLCCFLRSEFNDLLARFRGMQKRLPAVANHELNAAQDQMALLGRKTAREKVTSFLIAFSDYAAKSGRMDNPITIPVTRQDIGDYLGLSTETVSRLFTTLNRERVITLLPNGQVHLNDKKQLSDMANQISCSVLTVAKDRR